MVERDEPFTLFFSNRSEREFRRAFKMFFRRENQDDRYVGCGFKKREDVLRGVGFPSSITRSDGVERWHFDLSYPVGGLCGYDASVIEMKAGKVITIGGII